MRIVLLIILILVTSWAQSQENPVYRKSANYGLAYKVSSKEASQIAVKGVFEAQELDLFQRVPFDTLKNSGYSEDLPHGFYVVVRLNELELSAELVIVQDLEIKLFRSKSHLEVVFQKNDSFNIVPTEALWNNRKLKFDEERQTFRIRTSKRKGIIRGSYQGKEYLFPLIDHYQDRFLKRVGKKTLNFFPIKIVTKPFIDTYKSIKYNEPYGTVHWIFGIFNPNLRTRQSSYGYIVVNKPKFKPGDTVFYKAKLAKLNGKPFKKDVQLVLGTYKKQSFKKTISLKEGEANGFIYLHDSLDLQLDQNYRLKIKHKDSEIASISIPYEDYNLKSETYQVLVSKKTHGSEPNKITLIGKDENDKRLRNVKYLLEAKLTAFYPTLATPTTKVSHSLMKSSGDLSPSEDTEIIIPDSVFRKLDSNYEVIVTFINASNDQQVIRKRAKFNTEMAPIELKLEKDSIHFELTNENYRNQNFQLDGYTQNWDLDSMLIVKANDRIKLNPAIENYFIISLDGKLSRDFDMSGYDAKVSFSYDRNAKSVDVSIKNPRKIPVWYSVYKGRTIYREGQIQDSLALIIPASKNQPVSIYYKYLWAGQIHNRGEDLPYYENILTLSVDHQKLILPGISDTIKVKVVDQKQRPVKGVDIAALSFTSKFKQNNVPDVPYFGRYRSVNFKRKDFSTLYSYNKNIAFNYFDWRGSLSLDSVTYYQLAFPEQLTVKQLKKTEGNTYVSLLPVFNGRPRRVSYVLMDGQPIFFNLGNKTDEIAHKITPGYHDFKIRTYKSLITLDSIYILANAHSVISIPRETSHPSVEEFFGAEKKGHWPLTAQENSLLESRSIRIVDAKNGIKHIVQGKSQFTPNVSKNIINAGPLVADSLSVFLQNNKELKLKFEPGYSYEIVNDQVFRKAMQNPNFYFRSRAIADILNFNPNKDLNKVFRPQRARYYAQNNWVSPSNFNLSRKGLGLLSVYPRPEDYAYINEFLVLDAQDNSVVDKFNRRWQRSFTEGDYVLISVLDDGFTRSDFSISEDHTTIVTPDIGKPIVLDSLYSLLEIEIEEPKIKKIRPPIITVPLPKLGTDGMITGIVTGSDDGFPLPQVSIFVKGTTLGTPTNADGTYTIYVPKGGRTLVFRFLGYVTQEIRLSDKKEINVQMVPDATSLGEVVVTGAPIFAQKKLSFSVAKRTAGLEVANSSFQIRGTNQLRADNNPLIIVDGVIIAQMSDINMADVEDISTMKGSTAAALYGSRAADGVIVITTKNKKLRQEEELSEFDISQKSEESAIRKTFRDYAFWQPSVKTDKNGIATFVVTYPEDITSWENHFLAMGRKKSGQLKTITKAYKPIVARLRAPQFLIQNDVSTLFGEVANYSGSEIDISRAFTVDGQTTSLVSTKVGEGHLDSLRLHSTRLDSVMMSYSLKSKVLSDGEQMTIPILEKGLKRNLGQFHMLSSDTSIYLKALDPQKPSTVSIQSDLLGIFLNDIQKIHEYAYWCNEQSASKLIALLAEKKISSKLDRPFLKGKQVRRVIRRLNRGMNEQDAWGWWEDMSTSYWVTNHVIRALYGAQNEFFNTKAELEKSINTLRNDLPEMNQSDLMMSLETILLIDSTAQVDGYLSMLEQMETHSLTSQLRLAKMRFARNTDLDISWLDSLENESLYGGIYFKDSINNLHSNDITATLMAYDLIKLQNPEDHRLEKIRKYLMLNTRSSNTYLLSQIIMSIGDNLEKVTGEESITVNGKRINDFPFIQTYQPGDSIKLSKSSNSDTYVSFTQSFWENQPKIQDQLGSLSITFLNKRQDKVATLKRGETYTMRVTVDLKEDMSYLMIEAPLVGGVQYSAKPKAQEAGAFREYFKEKSNLYFEFLKRGQHSFDIPLIAMFPGEYTLNPAQMGSMYQADIVSNSKMEKLRIK